MRHYSSGLQSICLPVLLLILAVCSSVSNAQESPPAAGSSNPGNLSSQEANQALKSAGRHLSEIAARVNPTVVNIESKRESPSGGTIEETGSGVFMTTPRFPQTFVITNRHVVAGARLNQITIHLHDRRIITPIEKLEDPESDLAVLKIAAADVTAAQFGDSDNLEIGHFVLAMGSPFGLSQSVTLGIISAKGRRSLELPERKIINQDFLQTDAAINPGNSGGPLIDLDGRVIGINTAIASQGGGNEGIGFSIPSGLVQYIVEQLLEYGRVRRGYLGVELDNKFDAAAARRYSLDPKYGTRIQNVTERGPAAQAGMQPDDIILNFDGVDIMDENDLINRVSLTPVNKRVRVIVLRKGQRETLTVTLIERPQNQQSSIPAKELPAEWSSPYRNTRFSVLGLQGSLMKQIGYSQTQGVVVRTLSENDSQQGLRLYDLIEEVARQPVKTPSEFQSALAAAEHDQDLLLQVTRIVDGQPQTFLLLWKPQTEQSSADEFSMSDSEEVKELSIRI